MVANQRMAEKVFISLNITCMFIVAIYMIFTNHFAGELSFFQLNTTHIEVVLLLIYSIIGFISAYLFYVLTRNMKIYSAITPWRVNTLRLVNVFFCILVVQLVFLVVTGVGRVGSQATSPYSPVFALLNIDSLFGIFYFLSKKSIKVNKFYFWLVVITYLIFKLLQGWSGVILLISFFELFFYFTGRSIRPWPRVIIIVLIPLCLILSGAKVYQYVFPYKFEIRGMGIFKVNYFESVDNLTNRLTFFPIAVGAYERKDEIERLALQEDTIFREIKGFFRPFAPRFLMTHKEFRSINNLVKQAFYPDIEAGTSADIGLIMYVILLFSINMTEGLLWIFFTATLLLINKFIIDSFEQFRGQLNFIYFLLVFKLCYTASLEVVFSYGSIGILFLLPLLFATGVIKIKRFRPVQNPN